MDLMSKTTEAAQLLAGELFSRFRAHSQEAEQVALQLIGAGHARLKLELVLAGEQPSMRLLLEPVEAEGEPVEIASSHPIEPTLERVASRMWFFSRLSHWSTRQ